MSRFIFEGYTFDEATFTAEFHYSLEGTEYQFTERAQFTGKDDYNREVLERALNLAYILVGVSYYKAFPTPEVGFSGGGVDEWQATFLQHVYQEGLSQFAFENNLSRKDLAQFSATVDKHQDPVSYDGQGAVSMQSGGKDSLLVATLLESSNKDYVPFYISSTDHYPAILDTLSRPLVQARRTLDRTCLQRAAEAGGKNGHVPVTYIAMSYALIQAVLLKKNTVLVAIAHEGEEPHAWIDDLPVNHQWSKTWQAEQLFAEYVQRYISPDIYVGSPLRQYSELKVAELFAQHAWPRFGDQFSSCNQANYQQGADNTVLTWCGVCSKCANSYLLFAPFVPPAVLQGRLGGQLFSNLSLTDTFKGLLGIDGVMKPFECVGETEELRRAYHLAQQNGYESLPFTVPPSTFSIDARYAYQSWTDTVMLS